LKRATGNWVIGDQFWDREVEVELLMERIREGANVLLAAPRRIGKTSLMKEAARRLEDEFLCLYVDLEKAVSPADAIVELSIAAHPIKPVWNKVAAIFENILGGTVESVKIDEVSIVLRGGLNAGNWQAKGDRLVGILASHEKPVVLLFDEVATLVNRLLRGEDYEITAERRNSVDQFLSWLRANGIRHQAKIRMVLTGSIGLEPLTRRAGLSATLNHLTPFHLGPWSRDVAKGCLLALAEEYKITLLPDAVEHILDLLGSYIPHHVQMFFDHVYQAARMRKTSEVTRTMVGEVFEHSMLGIRGHAELSHLEERLKTVLGPNLDLLALDLLTEVAVTGSLTAGTAATLAQEYFDDEWATPLRDVLGILEHDGYLRSRDNVYRFESDLLRSWWKARFEFGYVPVAERQV
ncbi:MAG: ATP-binding protein, partial [Bryobacteraceae bacterium]